MASRTHLDVNSDDGGLHPAVRGALRVVWHTVRLPMLAFLLALQPLVEISLSAVAVLGVLTALFFKLDHLAHFSFFGMLAFSCGATLLLMAYHALVGLLSR